MSNSVGKAYSFGPFRLDVEDRALTRDGQRIPLSPKEFETLQSLVENNGRLVDKERLIARVWPDAFVGDGSLTRNICVLRKALGDDMIQTVPKLGYRLAATVTTETTASSSVTAETAPVPVPAQVPEPGLETPRVSAPPNAIPPARTNSIGTSWLTRRRAWLATVPVVAVGVVAALFILRGLSRSKEAARVPADPVRIAVLPFVNLTGDQHQEYLCDGMTEEMITTLGKLSPGRLGVIARTSSMTFKNSNRTAAEIGQSLNVNYLLECSVRQATDRLHINAQLIRTSDQVHVWAQEYDREMRDVLNVQAEVAKAIAEEIQIQLPLEGNGRLAAVHAVNPKAYEAYAMGRFFWNKRSAAGTRAAIGYFEQALHEDPTYGPAYAALADSYIIQIPEGSLPLPDSFRDMYELAITNARKAVEMDDSLAEAHTSLAWLEYLGGNANAAEKEFRRAIELDPGYATAHHWFGLFLKSRQRWQEAESEFRKALESDPLSVPIRCNAAMCYLSITLQTEMMPGRKERYLQQAQQLLDKALELEPGSIFVHGSLGTLYADMGKHDDSAAEFQKAADLTGWLSGYDLAAAHENALAGKKRQAESALNHILDRSKREGAPVAAYEVASIYVALGENESAFYWIDQALREHATSLAAVESNPNFQSLKSDQRFLAMQRKFSKRD